METTGKVLIGAGIGGAGTTAMLMRSAWTAETHTWELRHALNDADSSAFSSFEHSVGMYWPTKSSAMARELSTFQGTPQAREAATAFVAEARAGAKMGIAAIALTGLVIGGAGYAIYKALD